MPVPPWPTIQQKPSTRSSHPITGSRSGANVRRPAHARVTWRAPSVVVASIASSARATSISSGRASHGSESVSSAGEHSMSPPDSGFA